MNVHVNNLQEFLDKGWVEISRTDHRVELAHPDFECLAKLRGGTLCRLDPSHNGKCTSVAFSCDGCDKRRRGRPEVRHEEAGCFCWMCVRLPEIKRTQKRIQHGG